VEPLAAFDPVVVCTLLVIRVFVFRVVDDG